MVIWNSERLGCWWGAWAGKTPDDQEAYRFARVMFLDMTNFENFYGQSRSGLMDAETWAKGASVVRWWFAHPGVRRWWRDSPPEFEKPFHDMIELEIMKVRS